ncbi:Major facilitator superfamily protein, partial [Klenkia terrae]
VRSPTAGPVPTAARPGVDADPDHLPVAALLVLALTGFLLIATETMPAGLLPQIAAGLDVGEGVAGQFVSAYAVGTVVAAIPAVTLTRGLRRKPLLLAAVLVFALATAVTTVSGDVVVSLVARFVAGAVSGLVWGMTAGYARRISGSRRSGRALAIASVGTPVGLALGTPLGSWVGSTLDWRWSFGALTALAVLTALLALVLVPDAPGQAPESRLPLSRVVRLPGIAPVLAVIVTWMLAHNVVYTYVSAYLRAAGSALSVDVVLVVFGVAAIGGLVVTGVLLDRWLRPLVLAGTGLFILAGAVLLVGRGSTAVVLVAVVVWGVAFGGAAAQLQTAIGIAGGANADVANTLLGVAFNVAIAAAGVLGAVVVGAAGGLALPVVMSGLAAAAVALTLAGRRTAFPLRP